MAYLNKYTAEDGTLWEGVETEDLLAGLTDDDGTQILPPQSQAAIDEVLEFNEVIGDNVFARGGMVPFKTEGGQVSWFYGVPKFQIEEYRPDGTLGTGTHPAFITNSGEADMLWYAAYDMSYKNNEVVSQPNAEPFSRLTHDEAVTWCLETNLFGFPGHRLTSVWDESAVALWLEKMVLDGLLDEPAGNTAYATYHNNPALSGHGTSWIKTGSMGSAACHNRESGGIADFVGNVWTRCNGAHLQDGEIFLALNNDPVEIDAPTSTGHYYSSSSGTGNGTPSLVTSAGAVVRNGIVGSDDHASHDSITGASGLASMSGASSPLLRLAGLAPHGDGTDMSGGLWLRTYGKRALLLRGSWTNAASAGPRAFMLSYAPTARHTTFGFRAAFLTDIS